jgi:hypothetical protein
VSFYISRAVDGGCCDCGDESAWDRSGFCSKHGRVHTRADMLASLPWPLPDTARVIFGGILEELLLFSVHIEAHRGYERQRTQALEERAPLLVEAVKWFTQKCCQFEGLALLAAQAFCQWPAHTVPHVAQDGLPGPLRKIYGYYGLPPGSAALPHEIRPSQSHDEPMDSPGDEATGAQPRQADGGGAPVAGGAGSPPGGATPATSAGTLPSAPTDLAARDASFPRIDKVILETLVLADVRMRSDCPELARALQALYLRLLSEPTFKRAFAMCYTANYQRLATQHFEACLPPSEETLFSSQVGTEIFPPGAATWFRVKGKIRGQGWGECTCRFPSDETLFLSQVGTEISP